MCGKLSVMVFDSSVWLDFMCWSEGFSFFYFSAMEVMSECSLSSALIVLDIHFIITALERPD